jgi:hypothetical protein
MQRSSAAVIILYCSSEVPLLLTAALTPSHYCIPLNLTRDVVLLV